MAIFGYVEDTVRQYIVEMINEIIKEENLPFERADAQIEIKERDKYGRRKRRKFPDIVIWKRGAVLSEGALLIELKQPIYPPLTTEVVEDAFVKASRVNIPYFATSNMQRIVLFDSFERASLMDRRKGIFKISDIGYPEEIRREDVRKEMKENLRKFLLEFADIYRGIKVLPKLPIDEFFIYNLRDMVDSLSRPFTEELIDRFEHDPKFKKGFQAWFAEQGWLPPFNTKDYYDEFGRAARQYLYLLANKLMFYLVMKRHIPTLPELTIPEDVRDGDQLSQLLQNYFSEAEKESGDYDTIFGMNFIERFPIPKVAVDGLRRFINGLSKHDFRNIGYADFGKIFDKLIPVEERHKLGQYFTSQRHRDGTYWPDVVDLIIGFTVKKPETLVLDGGCGAGTFLVRSYARMKYLNPYIGHRDIISRLYGIDISKFAALLSSINLAIRDLSVRENYPIIINDDFFDVHASEDPSTMRIWVDEGQRVLMLTKKERAVKLPLVQAFVGNPPYTRQEEMEDYIPGYKEKLMKVVKNEWGVQLGKRSSIYVYFMLHGMKFLKEGGRLGYVTSNSWLDVDYGKYLQKFLLDNSKIIAVIESKVERWFEDADINTAITIAERCNDGKERESNLVKFVQLKKRLEDIIPTTNERARWEAIDGLVEKIENTDEFYEDEALRIYPKKQGELLEEGIEEVEMEDGTKKEVYVGSKWGKYIRAPEIFFKILEKGKGLFVPLKEVAEVRRGFTTGANEFFYLTEEEIRKWGIEREFWMHPVKRDEWPKVKDFIPREDVWIDGNGEYFKRSQYAEEYELGDVLINGKVVWVPNYLIKSPRECRSIVVDPKDLKYRVLMIHRDKRELRGTNVLKYIEWGEERGFHERPTCRSRQRWYDLGTWKFAEVLLPERIWERSIAFSNIHSVFENKNLYGIIGKKKGYSTIICLWYNSILGHLLCELAGRSSLGQGVLDIDVWMMANTFVLNPEKLTKELYEEAEKILLEISSLPVESILKEIPYVKTGRRKIDEFLLGKILGLTNEEQLEVYKAVIDLVKSRIERAKSVKRQKKKLKGLDIDELSDVVLREAKLEPLPNFPDEYIEGLDVKTVELPSGRAVKIEATLEGARLVIDGQVVACSSLDEAEYLYWSALAGKTKVPIPKDERRMAHAVKVFKEEFDVRVKKLDEWLEENVPSVKDRKKMRSRIIERLLRPR